MSSIKSEIRHFHVVVVQKRVMQVQSCCFAYKTYCFFTFSLPSALDLKLPTDPRWRSLRASSPHLQQGKRAARKRARERRSHDGPSNIPAPRTRVSFREQLSRDFLRLPHMESLLAGYRRGYTLNIFQQT